MVATLGGIFAPYVASPVLAEIEPAAIVSIPGIVTHDPTHVPKSTDLPVPDPARLLTVIRAEICLVLNRIVPDRCFYRTPRVKDRLAANQSCIAINIGHVCLEPIGQRSDMRRATATIY